jgi:hypothetical protein
LYKAETFVFQIPAFGNTRTVSGQVKTELKIKTTTMTADEKQLFKDLFKKFKGLYYRQKVNDDLIERILRKLPNDTVPNDVFVRIENTDGKLTEAELKELEDRINNL